MSGIYEFTSYRSFLLQQVKPASGSVRGRLLALARAAAVHPSVLSQVLKGDRDLSPEQALATAEHLELMEAECRYFLLLVQLERAGTESLRRLIRSDLERLRLSAREVSQRVPTSAELSNEQKAIFYSNWFYSALRIYSSIEKYSDPFVLRKKLGLEVDQFEDVLGFLIQQGLVRNQSGKIVPGIQNTHLDGRSPLISQHHTNWRIKAIQNHPSLNHSLELAYTAPVSLSLVDVVRVRNLVLDLIQQSCKLIDPSEPEVGYCLNIDWFEI